MNEWIAILGQPVYSKKNSKVVTKDKRVLSSKRVREYEKKMLPVYEEKRDEWKRQYDKAEKPVEAEFYFIRPTKAKFDYINLAQLPLDMLQTAVWIEDDDNYHIKPSFAGWEINKDKSKCGFKIRIIE